MTMAWENIVSMLESKCNSLSSQNLWPPKDGRKKDEVNEPSAMKTSVSELNEKLVGRRTAATMPTVEVGLIAT